MLLTKEIVLLFLGNLLVLSAQVSLSVVEIYCERIRDLLAPAGQNADNLAVLRNKVRGVFVAGATEIPVHNEEELIHHMKTGIANRTVAATGMNATSSRSHCVVSDPSGEGHVHCTARAAVPLLPCHL